MSFLAKVQGPVMQTSSLVSGPADDVDISAGKSVETCHDQTCHQVRLRVFRCSTWSGSTMGGGWCMAPRGIPEMIPMNPRQKAPSMPSFLQIS